MSRVPAILGGEPLFDPAIPFAQPTFESPEEVMDKMSGVLTSGRMTNGPLVRQLEERVAEFFDVQHCVAVASGTTGLILLIQAIAAPGTVLLPSFTFSATAHAARWNNKRISFADCDPETWCITPSDIAGQPGLVIGVHISGVPCDIEGLEVTTAKKGAKLVFDAAHGAGSQVTIAGRRRRLGAFGLAEVFSLTPTKVLSGAEGGLITTNDASLAEHLRVALQYGDPGNYNTAFAGLNGRLSEMHAAVALTALGHLDERVEHRNRIAKRYRGELDAVPGIRFQHVPEGSTSSYKDFSILIDRDEFGAGRDAVSAALASEGVEHRSYYSPPVHRHMAYQDRPTRSLPVTDRLASQVISLPIWSHLPLPQVDRIASALKDIHTYAKAVEHGASITDSAD